MWEVTEDQVVAEFQQDSGGRRFTAFVNSLIRSEMYVSGAPLSEFVLVDRSTVGDGGVDGEVRSAVPGDRTGWMRDGPTLWQFTARDGIGTTLSKLGEDFGKSYAVSLVKKGYAGRACIRGVLQPNEIERWERELTEIARSHNADAPPVAVIAASGLAKWASTVPGVASAHLRVALAPGAIHMMAWARNATADTEKYIDVPP